MKAGGKTKPGIKDAGRPGVGPGRAWHLASVVGAVVIWSTSFVATKVALAEVPPLTLGASRFVFAAVLAGALAFVFGAVRVANAADLGRFALGGLLGITLYFSLENVGVDLATASDAALLVASYPVVTMLLEAGLYRKRLSAIRLSGAALAIVGVNVVLGNAVAASAGEDWGSARIIGCAILVATGLVWALYNFSTRTVVSRYSMLTVVFWQTLFGALFFLPVAFAEQVFTGGARWLPEGGVALVSVAHLGVLCSVAAFLLYAHGLRGVDASAAVSVMNLVPVLGVLFAVALLGESLGILQVLGGVVVVAGVMLGVRGGDGGESGRYEEGAGTEARPGTPVPEDNRGEQGWAKGNRRKETMLNVRDTKKCVVVVDGELPAGLMVNAAACLAVTLGERVEDINGEDATDGSGMVHPGLIPTGIAILQADADAIKDTRLKAEVTEGVFVADFTDAAQTPRDYGEYLQNISNINSEDLRYLGVGLYGDKKAVGRLTGGLALLR